MKRMKNCKLKLFMNFQKISLLHTGSPRAHSQGGVDRVSEEEGGVSLEEGEAEEGEEVLVVAEVDLVEGGVGEVDFVEGEVEEVDLTGVGDPLGGEEVAVLEEGGEEVGFRRPVTEVVMKAGHKVKV